MRYPFIRQIVVSLLLATTASAAEPLAVITSAESFEISGVSVPVTGVTSWPLVEGDEVVTKGSGAILMFDNQTKVVLDKDSAVELKRRDRKTTVQLLKGALKYSLPVGSLLQILARGREVDLSSNRGSVSVADQDVFVTPLGSDADVVFASTAQSSQFLLTPPARSPADCRNLTPGEQGGRSQCAPE
jgi:hypothetical protein